MLFTKGFYTKTEALFQQYPRKVNALLPVLHLAQEEKGFLNPESMEEVAKLCEVPVSHVEGVVSFYTMYYQEPKGKVKFHVCMNLTCWIKGSEKIIEHLEEKLGLAHGEVSEDGNYFLQEVECLGACGYAPVIIYDDQYYENTTIKKVDELLADAQKKLR